MVAFCRIDESEIRLREPVMQPDALIIQDPTLLHQVDVFAGLVPDGYILINTTAQLRRARYERIRARLQPRPPCTVPATELALKHVGRPLPNAALLGGFAALSGRISLDAVAAAIAEKFSGKLAEGNVAAAAAASST